MILKIPKLNCLTLKNIDISIKWKCILSKISTRISSSLVSRMSVKKKIDKYLHKKSKFVILFRYFPMNLDNFDY